MEVFINYAEIWQANPVNIEFCYFMLRKISTARYTDVFIFLPHASLEIFKSK